MPRPFAAARALFALGDYRRMWAIGGLSGIARWLEFVAIAVFAYQLTHSPELVALLAVFRMLAYLLFGFVMGGLADAVDRKWLLIASLATMTVTSTVMAVLAATGSATYAAIAVASAIAGAVWTTDMPVRRRLMVDAVGSGNVAGALGFDNSTQQATRALGPLIGGASYEILGIGGIYALIAASYLACVWLAARVQVQAEAPAAPQSGRTRLAFLLPSRELLADRRFQVVMGVTLVFNLWCWPFVNMVPVIAQKDFALSPTMVGALAACDGLGGTLGALAVGLLATPKTLFRLYYLGTLAYLLLVLALSLHLTVGTAVWVLVLIGIAGAGFAATQYALVYSIAPPDMRGRATGVLSIFIGSSMLGFYHTGWLFERLGSAPAMQVMVAEALVVMMLLAVWWWRARAHPAA